MAAIFCLSANLCVELAVLEQLPGEVVDCTGWLVNEDDCET